jgi:cytochrome c oxidase subunit 2
VPDIKLVPADNPLGLDRSDPDAKDDITDINTLHLPVNRPVWFSCRARTSFTASVCAKCA